jgi:hypothetical protein
MCTSHLLYLKLLKNWWMKELVPSFMQEVAVFISIKSQNIFATNQKPQKLLYTHSA